ADTRGSSRRAPAAGRRGATARSSGSGTRPPTPTIGARRSEPDRRLPEATAGGGLCAGGVVAVHQLRDGVARGLPLRLIAEHVGVPAPALDLGHRRDDRVLLGEPVS